MGNGKSILQQPATTYQTPPTHTIPRVGWDVNRFESLIQNQGYDVYIDRALRCPCCDRNNGQALSTCKNCGGRGWIFVDRTETRIIAQHMDSKKKYADWGEVNYGTASFTSKGIDKLGFMDRIILMQLEEAYSETLLPVLEDDEIVAYPIYEPLLITNAYLLASASSPLIPLTTNDYTVEGNKIKFEASLLEKVTMTLDINSKELPLQITIRYTHYPVYHVIDVNRELMKVREGKLCQYNDEQLRQMPINVVARKAHYLFQQQRSVLFDNSVIPGINRK